MNLRNNQQYNPLELCGRVLGVVNVGGVVVAVVVVVRGRCSAAFLPIDGRRFAHEQFPPRCVGGCSRPSTQMLGCMAAEERPLGGNSMPFPRLPEASLS